MAKCSVCKTKYEPRYNTLQPTCNDFGCMATHATNKREAKQKKDKAENKKMHKDLKKKVRLHDRSWHIKTLQVEFNKFIRLRDEGNDCISCGKPPKKKNAGHYRSRGSAPELRFVEDNCHLQCEHCNSFKSGNIENYRPALLAKIGLSRLLEIEGPHEPKKYSIPKLQDMIKVYRAKVKSLESML